MGSLLNFIIFLLQYYIVIITIDDHIIIVGENSDNHALKYNTTHFYLRILNTANVFFTFNKLLVLIRFNEKFALLMKLLKECVKDLFQFMVFMIAWIFFFMLVALILGIEIPDEKFPGVEYRIRTFIFFWMTSMGEIE